MMRHMDHIYSLLALLIGLIILSAFFSAAETSMMAINRYRLRHLGLTGNKSAQRVSRLLERTDRLLGIILICNTFANILASAVATLIALSLLGEVGVAISTIALTLVVLIFGEVTPKTFAALRPEKIAFLSSWPLLILLKILYPLVWLTNTIANGLLTLFHVKISKRGIEPLNSEELQTVVKEATGHIAPEPQDMLLRILELEKITVEDVMVPRNDIVGIDLNEDWEVILKQITDSHHTRLLLYKDGIDGVQGIIHLRKVLNLIVNKTLDKESLLTAAEQVYFVPEGTTLGAQLVNFKIEKCRSGLVVDEYGDIQGLVTLEDILEEIVGEFTTNLPGQLQEIFPQKDGTYIVLGSANIRELNRSMHWDLPTDGPKTLNGLILEYLELIPSAGIGLRLSGYPMEILQVEGNIVRTARIYPALRNIASPEREHE